MTTGIDSDYSGKIVMGQSIDGIIPNGKVSILSISSSEVIFLAAFVNGETSCYQLNMISHKLTRLVSYSKEFSPKLFSRQIAYVRTPSQAGEKQLLLICLTESDFGTQRNDSHTKLFIYSLTNETASLVGDADIGYEDVYVSLNADGIPFRLTSADSSGPARKSFSKIFWKDMNEDGYFDVVIKTWNYTANNSRSTSQQYFALANINLSVMFFDAATEKFLSPKEYSDSFLKNVTFAGFSSFPLWPINAPEDL